ncbi:FAD-dependent monooxygenase [Neopusillimonas maritima]|uniref:Monooxygenase n=1 Tax=Neopusillimonas maritima TaxID=2026239 RepID=A0ABX9MZ72_9BURK|nr:FAD-dependent monooxygenase [Neopusillimonas maritima]RII84275.1 monooxygenase [Neopusillimonas maritima]
MSDPDYDIVIAGAGPVGSALALMLARYAPQPERIALVGASFMRRGASPNEASDPRSIAVNHGSIELLRKLKAWPAHYRPIETVHVSQQGRLGRTVIQHTDLNVAELGGVVNYTDLLTELHHSLASSGISCIELKHAALQLNEYPEVLADTRRIQAYMGVQSDGIRPKGLNKQYDQCAVLTVVKAGEPRPGWAFERFTRQGPLALLPHPSGANHYGVVWCCRPDTAAQLRDAPDTDFNTQLQSIFGERLGTLSVLGERAVYPLSLHAGPTRIGRRGIAIGNAAQTLHPVAGQGLNLGLRDAAQLAHTLRFWLTQPSQDPGPMLEHYTQLRKPDRWLTTGITDFLPRIFSTKQPLVEHAAGLALLGMDLSLGARMPLAHHLLQGLRR